MRKSLPFLETDDDCLRFAMPRDDERFALRGAIHHGRQGRLGVPKLNLPHEILPLHDYYGHI